jgi:hypothetical protein
MGGIGTTALVAVAAESNTIDVTSSVTSILGVGSQVMTFITGDTLLLTLFCGSLVGLGCYVIRKVKGVAKH